MDIKTTYADAKKQHPKEVAEVWDKFQTKSKSKRRKEPPENFTWQYTLAYGIPGGEARTNIELVGQGLRYSVRIDPAPKHITNHWPRSPKPNKPVGIMRGSDFINKFKK